MFALRLWLQILVFLFSISPLLCEALNSRRCRAIDSDSWIESPVSQNWGSKSSVDPFRSRSRHMGRESNIPCFWLLTTNHRTGWLWWIWTPGRRSGENVRTIEPRWIIPEELCHSEYLWVALIGMDTNAQIWRAMTLRAIFLGKANRRIELQDKPYHPSIVPFRLGDTRFCPIGTGFHPVMTGWCWNGGVYPAPLSVIQLKEQFDTSLHSILKGHVHKSPQTSLWTCWYLHIIFTSHFSLRRRLRGKPFDAEKELSRSIKLIDSPMITKWKEWLEMRNRLQKWGEWSCNWNCEQDLDLKNSTEYENEWFTNDNQQLLVQWKDKSSHGDWWWQIGRRKLRGNQLGGNTSTNIEWFDTFFEGGQGRAESEQNGDNKIDKCDADRT
jgi:hypothetical protein